MINNEKICTVNNLGEFTFLNINIPESVPKVKHTPRVLHDDYVHFLRNEIENRVKLKKINLNQKEEYEQKLKQLNRSYLIHFRRNIEKWFNI